MQPLTNLYHLNRNVSRWRFINAAILMNFMSGSMAASEDVVAADRNGDIAGNDIDGEDDDEIEGMIDRYIVRSNSDPGENLTFRLTFPSKRQTCV